MKRKRTFSLSVKLPDYAASHAAFDELDKQGPQRGIDAGELHAPIPYPPQRLVAHGALSADPHPSTLDGLWVKLPFERIDPRAPWREIPTGFVAPVPGGFVAIRPPRDEVNAWVASLLPEDPGISDPEHVLMHRAGPSVFESDTRARRFLNSVVMADGALPAGYTWAGSKVEGGEWEPGSPGESASAATIYARGPRRLVTIRGAASYDVYPGWTIWRGRFPTRPVRDPSGHVQCFNTLAMAKAYVRQQGWLWR